MLTYVHDKDVYNEGHSDGFSDGFSDGELSGAQKTVINLINQGKISLEDGALELGTEPAHLAELLEQK